MKHAALIAGKNHHRQARFLLVLSAFATAGCVFADGQPPVATSLPRVFHADPRVLAEARARLAAGDPALKPALDQLLADADTALKTKPVSVMDKQKTPSSGDKHDFVSQAPYFWPNPKTKDGLPYIRKDGERNPESRVDSDAGRFGAVSSSAHTLALGYFFTGNMAYATHAAELVRVWFLNPATRMNPNLNFGQGVPGETEGRAAGLIGVRSFVQLVDAFGLLADSKAWTAGDQKAMTAWVEEYLRWLTTSKIGRAEAKASNNHGTFYDAQLAALALFVGKTNLAKTTLENARRERIAKQIEPDGRQPRELARTKSFDYSVFNLSAMIDLASIGQNVGVDLWHYQTDDGRSIRKALEFMSPYADPSKQWPYQQIKEISRQELGELLLRAAAVFPESAFHNALKHFDAKELAASRARLMFKTAPVQPGNAGASSEHVNSSSSHAHQN